MDIVLVREMLELTGVKGILGRCEASDTVLLGEIK